MPEQWPTVSVDGHPISETWRAETVRVAIYGGDFNSIQAAINYAVTQTPTAANRWTVLVYPGTYGVFTMAQYVDVVGVDKESVIIAVTAGTAVTMANDTRIANVTINPLATGAGSAYGIETGDAGCRIEDLNMYLNRTAGVECVGIIENTGNTARDIYIRNVHIITDLVTNTNTHAISIRQANKTVHIEESYIQGSDYGMALGVSGGAAVASTIYSKQNFFQTTAAASRPVFNNGGNIYLHEDSIARGCRLSRENAGVILYTDGNEIYHVFEGMDIQDTLNNIPVAGCKVWVHDGTYAIVDPIIITQNNVTLQGDGQNTFIDGDGLATGEHAIVISGKINVTIKDLAIQTEDGGGKVCHCIFIEDGSDDCHIENVTIIESDSDGIHVEGTLIYRLNIHNCHIYDADGYGIFIDMDAGQYFQEAHIWACHIYAHAAGIFFGNTGVSHNYCEVEDNVVWGAATYGIQALNMLECDIHNNICLYNGADGIILGTSSHCDIESNICFHNVSDGIEMATSTKCNINGNFCHENTARGIYLDGASDDNHLGDNYCYLNGTDGIGIGGSRNSVVGNHCYENDEHGINVGNPDNTVNDNYCYDNSQAGAGTYHGMNLGADADRTQVNDNHCICPGDSQEDGIHLEDGATDCQIVGNYCYNGMGSGIALIANNIDCLIDGNFCKENDDYGIEITAASCSKNRLVGNQLDSNATANLLDSGTLTTVEESNGGIMPPQVRRYVYMKNTSGGALAAGNVVVFKAVAAGDEFTTTVTKGDRHVLGMVAEAINNDAYGYVLIAGKAIVLSVSNDHGNIAIGDFLCCNDVATEGCLAAAGDTAFAIALEACTSAACTLDALLINPLTF